MPTKHGCIKLKFIFKWIFQKRSSELIFSYPSIALFKYVHIKYNVDRITIFIVQYSVNFPFHLQKNNPETKSPYRFSQHTSRNLASWWGKRVRPLFGKRDESTNIVVTYRVGDKSRSFDLSFPLCPSLKSDVHENAGSTRMAGRMMRFCREMSVDPRVLAVIRGRG